MLRLDRLGTLSELLRDRTVRLAVTGLAGQAKQLHHQPRPQSVKRRRPPGPPAVLPRHRGAPHDRRPARFAGERSRRSVSGSRCDCGTRSRPALLAGEHDRFAPSQSDTELHTGRFSGGTGGTAELRLEILDYPGEWLLDLPLLGQTYRDWSRATLEQARCGARAPLARDWLDFLARHPAESAGDAEAAQRAHALYRSFLVACRTQEQLSLLQPGRFLNPGQIADPSLLWFCPMPFAIGAHAREGSMAALMEARFDVYKRTVVQPFFTQLARGVDRQIVLVDVLRALNAGQAAFADQRLAFETILAAFRFGRRNILRLLFGARIDRVLFAATKADHVPALQRDHLEALMANLVAVPTLRAEAAHARVAATALASIRCTEDGTDVIDGRKVDVVIGLPEGSERRIRFFPGSCR